MSSPVDQQKDPFHHMAITGEKSRHIPPLFRHERPDILQSPSSTVPTWPSSRPSLYDPVPDVPDVPDLSRLPSLEVRYSRNSTHVRHVRFCGLAECCVSCRACLCQRLLINLVQFLEDLGLFFVPLIIQNFGLEMLSKTARQAQAEQGSS